MKRNLFGTFSLGGLPVLLNVTRAIAQSGLEANVPFAFNVGTAQTAGRHLLHHGRLLEHLGQDPQLRQRCHHLAQPSESILARRLETGVPARPAINLPGRDLGRAGQRRHEAQSPQTRVKA